MRKIYLSLIAAFLLIFSANAQLNYHFTAISGTYTNLSGGDTAQLVSSYEDTSLYRVHDEGFANDLPIGFPFIYNGAQYNTISVNTNGFAAFTSFLPIPVGDSSDYYTPDLAAGPFFSNKIIKPVLAPLWDDHDLFSNSGITYKTEGANGNRVFTIQWNGVYWPVTSNSTTGTVISFQLKLYEGTNVVEFRYRDDPAPVGPGARAQIGISGFVNGRFVALLSSSTSPTPSTTNDSAFITKEPATGQVYQFTPVTTFYSKASGDLSDPATWGTNTDGTGTPPPNFTAYDQQFTVTNRTGTVDLSSNADTIRMGGQLTLDQNINLVTGGKLVIKSFPTYTGRIGMVPANSTIFGNTTVERYITSQNNRAYRLLTPTVTANGNVFSNWQESKTYVPSEFGISYGTHVTGNSLGRNGLDATVTGQPSMYTYNQVTEQYDTVRNTMDTLLLAKKGYLIFIRGDRNPAHLQSAASSSDAILRATGTLLFGDQTFGPLQSGGNGGSLTIASSSGGAITENPAGTYTGNNSYGVFNRSLPANTNGSIQMDIASVSGANNSYIALDASMGNDQYGQLDYAAVVYNGTYRADANDNLFDSGIPAQDGDQLRLIRTGDSIAAQYGRAGVWNTFFTFATTNTGALNFKFHLAGNGSTMYNPAASGGNSGFSLVTNPYAAPINWNSIYNDPANNPNFGMYYTYLDPNVGSRGAYVSVPADASLPNSAGGKGTLEIQSGQAFFIQANGGVSSPSLVIRESHKGMSANIDVFRTAASGPIPFSVGLYYNDATRGRRLADGATAIFKENYTKGFDGFDAQKVANFDENIGFARANRTLSIESRPIIQNADTLFLATTRLKAQKYELQFTPGSFENTALTATLKDNFLKTITQISLNTTTVIPFTVTNAPGSFAADRFQVIFGSGALLPITMSDVKAYQQAAGIQVDWKMLTESNMDHYEVEKSTDGQHFTKAATVASKGNSTTENNYGWLDGTPANGANYYRIRSISKTGSVEYSAIVKVTLNNGKEFVTVFPNPVKGGVVNLQLNNLQRGNYNVTILNDLGQQVYNRSISHTGGIVSYKLQLGAGVPHGIYQMHVTGQGKVINQQLLVNNK